MVRHDSLFTDLHEESASRERAIREASDGTFLKRRDKVVDLAYGHGSIGITFKDVDAALGTHHGQSSGALSTLHKEGKLYRLTKYRKPNQPRCSVYVHPDHAGVFEPDEILTSPSESKMQRLVREASDYEQIIQRLLEEKDFLERRLEALKSEKGLER